MAGEADADVYKAIADPIRRAIPDELTERTGQALFEPCARLHSRQGISLSRQAVSRHPEILEAAGLVHSRRSRRHKFHDLDTTPLRAIAERRPAPPEPGGTP